MTGSNGRTRADIGTSILALKRARDSAWLTLTEFGDPRLRFRFRFSVRV